MKETAYQQAMRLASFILFVIAMFVLLAGLVQAIFVVGISGSMGQGMGGSLTFAALVGAFNQAAIPFFGAALLHRMDKWLETRP